MSRRVLGHTPLLVGGTLALAALTAPAGAAVALYSNNFNTQAAGNNTGTMTATTFTQATPGPISFTDQGSGDFALSTADTDAANGRGSFGFRFGGAGTAPTEPVLSFWFTVDGPVSGTMQMRIDNQTNNAVGSGTQFIIGTNLTTPLASTSAAASKTLLYFMNQGTANKDYLSPVDGATVTLEPGTFDFYLRNNETGTSYALLGQNQAFTDRNGATDGFGELNKFALGNTANAEVNSFTIDDVLLENDITEAFAVVPEPSALALLGIGGLLALRRRR